MSSWNLCWNPLRIKCRNPTRNTRENFWRLSLEEFLEKKNLEKLLEGYLEKCQEFIPEKISWEFLKDPGGISEESCGKITAWIYEAISELVPADTSGHFRRISWEFSGCLLELPLEELLEKNLVKFVVDFL